MCEESVVAIYNFDEINNEYKFLGTGFVIHVNKDATYILTCDHVTFNEEAKKYYSNIEVLIEHQGMFRVSRILDKPDFDLTVLELPPLEVSQLTLNLSGSYKIKRGDEFHTIGNSITVRYQELITSRTSGKFIRLFRIAGKLGDRRQIRVPAWTVEINPQEFPLKGGNSGSPIFNAEGTQVLGVLTKGTYVGITSNGNVDNNQGIVISIKALEHIWKDMPNKAILSLSSTQDEINYIKLRNLLAQSRWWEANDETVDIIFKIHEKIIENQCKEIKLKHLEPEDVRNFPLQDLLTIDKLWNYYSKGYFGILIQNDIYTDLYEDDRDVRWEKLCSKLDWKDELKDYEKLKSKPKYEKLKSNLKLELIPESELPPRGYLPYLAKKYEYKNMLSTVSVFYGIRRWQCLSERLNKHRIKELEKLLHQKERTIKDLKQKDKEIEELNKLANQRIEKLSQLTDRLEQQIKTLEEKEALENPIIPIVKIKYPLNNSVLREHGSFCIEGIIEGKVPDGYDLVIVNKNHGLYWVQGEVQYFSNGNYLGEDIKQWKSSNYINVGDSFLIQALLVNSNTKILIEYYWKIHGIFCKIDNRFKLYENNFELSIFHEVFIPEFPKNGFRVLDEVIVKHQPNP